MSYKATLALCVVSAALSGAAAYRWSPKDSVTTQEVIKDRVVTVTRVVTKPDGTRTEDTRVVDTSVTKKDTSVTSTPALRSDWHVGVSASRSLKSDELVYSLQVERRILGPMHVGVRLGSDQSAGVILGWEF